MSPVRHEFGLAHGRTGVQVGFHGLVFQSRLEHHGLFLDRLLDEDKLYNQPFRFSMLFVHQTLHIVSSLINNNTAAAARDIDID